MSAVPLASARISKLWIHFKPSIRWKFI